MQTAAPLPFCSSILVFPKAKAFFSCLKHHKSFKAAHQGLPELQEGLDIALRDAQMGFWGVCAGQGLGWMIPAGPCQLGMFDGSVSTHHAVVYCKHPKLLKRPQILFPSSRNGFVSAALCSPWEQMEPGAWKGGAGAVSFGTSPVQTPG